MGSTTYYAVWGVDVTWVDEDTVSEQTDILYGTRPVSEWTEIREREGYVFVGWKSSADGKTYKTSDAVPAVTQPTTFTAVWAQGKSSVTFDANMGGKESMRKTTTATYDDELPAIPDGAAEGDLEGFKFAGYFDADGVQYYDSEGEPVVDAWDKADENVTMYAHWKYKVFFDKNDDEAEATLVKLIGGVGPETIVIHDEDVEGKTAWMWATYHGANPDATYPTVYLPGATRVNYGDDAGTGKFGDLLQWSYAGGKAAAGVQLENQNAFDSHLTMVDGVKAITLEADWAGVATRYTVRLIADTPFEGGAGADALSAVEIENGSTRTKTVANVPYGSLLSAGTPDTGAWPIAVPVPEGSQHVRFAGYYGKPNASATDLCYINADGTVSDSNRVLDRSTLNTAGEIELYARWEVAEYTVRFELTDAKGSASTVKSQTPDAIEGIRMGDAMPDLAWGGNASASGKKPVRDGYSFRGYFDENGIQYYTADLKKVADDVVWRSAYDADTLYARWTYEVKLDMNLGTSGTPSKDAVLAADGSTLKGQSSASQVVSVKANEYTSSKARDAFSFSEDASGENVVPTGLSRTRNGEATGYAFVGFTTVKDDASTLIDEAWLADDANNPGALLPSGKTSKTLYALWDAADYEVALVASEYQGFVFGDCLQEVAEGRTETVSATYDEPLSGDIAAPVMRGYAFLGYFDAPQTTAAVSDGAYSPVNTTMFYDREGHAQTDAWTEVGNTVLYAHYYRVPYRITFTAGEGASGGNAPLSVWYGYDLSDATVGVATMDGYAFEGWQDETGTPYFDSSGNGCDIAFGVGMDPLVDVALTPIWSGKTYTIAWVFDYGYQGMEWSHCHGDGIDEGTGAMVQGPVLYDQTVTFPDPYDYSVAYGFFGWYTGKSAAVNRTEAELAEAKYFEEQADGTWKFKPSNASGKTEFTFYAGWSEEPTHYEITLRAGEHGSFAAGEKTHVEQADWTGDPEDDIKLAFWKGVLDDGADAGWAFDKWVEETEEGAVIDEDPPSTVPLGTGNRYFRAAWKLDAGHSYTIAFDRSLGDEVKDAKGRPYDFVYLDGFDDDGIETPFDASPETTVDVPALVRGGQPVTETLGYAFDGWYRVKAEDGKTVLAEDEGPLTKTVYGGQELANMAKAAGTDHLYFAAKWAPKTFDVRYRTGSSVDSPEMASGAATGISYADEVTLATPVLEQTGKRGNVFSRWEGASDTSQAPMLPGAKMTVLELVKKAGSSAVDRESSTVWLHPEWVQTYSFCVPLAVSIAIDPERPEGAKAGEGCIRTDSPNELFVESVSFARDENLSDMLTVKGDDLSDKVSLTIRGDGEDYVEALEQKLGATGAVSVHEQGLAEHGLGALKATSDADGIINVEYGLKLLDGALKFSDFEKLMSIKDSGTGFNVGRVFYTLSLAR